MTNQSPKKPYDRSDPLPWYVWAGFWAITLVGLAFLLMSIVGGASSDMAGNSW